MWQTELEPNPDFLANVASSHLLKFFVVVFVIAFLRKNFDKNRNKPRLRDPRILRPVSTKSNLHPELLPDVLLEILSRADVLTLYKCRAVNSEWAEIGSREIKQRFTRLELESKTWEDIPYRPSDQDILDSVVDEDGERSFRNFYGGRLAFFKSYTVDYPKAYHIQDLLIAQALGKKILDVNSMQSLGDIYPTNYILSPDFPFLLKVGFRYENYSLVFKEAKNTGLAFKLTPKNMPKSLPMFNRCEYEALFDMPTGKAYNIRILKEPKLTFGILPLDEDDKFLAWVFGLSAFIADNWTMIFPYLFDWLLVLLSGYALSTILVKEYPKMSSLVAFEILGLLLYNYSMLFGMLKFFVVICIGYNIQSFLIRSRQVIPTTELGKAVIGTALALDLIYMNTNLQLFITSIMNGNILWTLRYYAILLGIGALHIFICMRMYPKGKIQQQVTKNFWLRVAVMIMVYIFYNPK